MLSNQSGYQPPRLLEVCHVRKRYLGQRGPLRRNAPEVVALDDVSLTIDACSTLALVGKSGSGKSTLARCIALLQRPDSGQVKLEGRDVLSLSRAELVTAHRKIQLIWQHSATAMNPSFSALQVVEEPLVIQKLVSRAERRQQAMDILDRVKFPLAVVQRSPLELSGGQRKRLVLARALILKPKLVILDEAFAGLDVSLQTQMAELLRDLQSTFSLSYLFITHDLRMAAHLSSRIAIIGLGRIIETGSVEDLFSRPQRLETRELIQAIPFLPNFAPDRTDAAGR